MPSPTKTENLHKVTCPDTLKSYLDERFKWLLNSKGSLTNIDTVRYKDVLSFLNTNTTGDIEDLILKIFALPFGVEFIQKVILLRSFSGETQNLYDLYNEFKCKKAEVLEQINLILKEIYKRLPRLETSQTSYYNVESKTVVIGGKESPNILHFYELGKFLELICYWKNFESLDKESSKESSKECIKKILIDICGFNQGDIDKLSEEDKILILKALLKINKSFKSLAEEIKNLKGIIKNPTFIFLQKLVFFLDECRFSNKEN